ncbi:hypothetical protein B9Z19DRAFT_1123391 [Tuber borchii]|uniref:Uncharacterized protein n=1 Tax=Tuber borchii TaxID=42251 RepID=A0A2T6ZYJ1_TUBBO|nr:hypothetical protein B9Z19DRAFT_1123391 [Tuber borchii]
MPRARKTRVQQANQPPQPERPPSILRKRKPLGTRSTNGVLPSVASGGNSVAQEERTSERERGKVAEVPAGEMKEKEKKSAIEKIRNLPPPPVHTPFQGLFVPHMAQSIGPATGLVDPYRLFSLFFSWEELEILAKNTNLYAAVHDAGIKSNSHPFPEGILAPIWDSEARWGTDELDEVYSVPATETISPHIRTTGYPNFTKDMVEKARAVKQQYAHSSQGVFFALDKYFHR